MRNVKIGIGFYSSFIVFLLLISACAFSHPNLNLASNPPTTKHLTKVDRAVPRLGDGYLTYDRVSVGESALKLDDTTIIYSNMQSTVNLDQTIDRESLAKDLNIDFSASGGWGFFSPNALARYLHYIEDTQYTESFIFSERYFVNALLDISRLPANITAFTNNAADLYNNKGINEFTTRYGDAFITQLPMGALLIANLKFSFASVLDKHRFNVSLGGAFGSIFNAKATIQNAITESKAKGFIEISAYQLGGDPSELPNIFAERANHGYYITRCNLDSWKNCLNAIDGIIRYAQTNFNKQIKPTVLGEKPEGNLAVVGAPFLNKYAAKFTILSPPPLDPAILESRFTLASNYKAIKVNKTFMDHFLASPVSSYFTPRTYKLLMSIKSILDWNFSLYGQFDVLRCYTPGEEAKCMKIVSDIKQYTKPVNQQAINYYIDSGYYQPKNGCIFIPVSLPQDERPMFAALCKGQWINGIFMIKMEGDKSTMQIIGDYITPIKGHHIYSNALLLPNGSFDDYAGVGTYKDITAGSQFKAPLSMRIIRNYV